MKHPPLFLNPKPEARLTLKEPGWSLRHPETTYICIYIYIYVYLYLVVGIGRFKSPTVENPKP